MNRTIRAAVLTLVFMMATTMVFAGGSKEKAATSPNKPYQVTMAYFTFGNTPPDLQLVQSAVNKIAQAKTGTTVAFLPISIGAYQQQMTLMIASNEPLDLMVTGSGFNYALQAAKGELNPLDQLIEQYGKGVAASMSPVYLNATKVNGKIYAVPTVRDFAASEGAMLKKSILDKYNIDPSSIKTYQDLGKVLELVHSKEPNIIPITTGVPGNSLVFWMRSWDPLGDGYGVLPDFGQNTKVVDIYETPQYASMLDMVHSWYKAGLVQKDIVTSKDHWSVFMKAGKLAGYVNIQKPGIEVQDSQSVGTQLVAIPLVKPFSSTSNVTNIMWAIARNSKDPAKAMEFLNLMYSDSQVVNLIDWGIEGKHYVKLPSGQIGFPPGVNAKNSGYNPNTGWEFGNQMLSYIWKTDPPDLWTRLKAFNARSVKSKALGFTFDPASVKTQIAAVTNVVNQYGLGLEDGVLNPTEVLPVFISKLKTAGIDTIIAAKQKQLDAWLAAK